MGGEDKAVPQSGWACAFARQVRVFPQLVGNDLSLRLQKRARGAHERGTDQSHVAKLTIYLTAGGDVTAGYQAAEVWGNHLTASSALQVGRLWWCLEHDKTWDDHTAWSQKRITEDTAAA